MFIEVKRMKITSKDRKYFLEVSNHCADVALKNKFFFTVCFWMSPVSEQLEHRVGYFESSMEAIMYSTMLTECYKNMKYYIVSNALEQPVDGNLFN